MLNGRVFDAPAVREAQQRLPVNRGEQIIAVADGRWSACDVYIQADSDAYATGPAGPGQEFFLRCETGNITTELFRGSFDDLAFPYQPGGVGVGRISGILFSARGRPSDRFIFGALPTRLERPEAWYRLRVWGEDGFYGDRPGRAQVQPFAGREQILQANVSPLVAGSNVIFPAHPQGRRNYITRIVISNDATDPAFGPMVLGDLDPITGVVTPISTYFTGPDAGTWIQDEFTYAARGNLGGVWTIDIPAPGGVISLSATGFAE